MKRSTVWLCIMLPIGSLLAAGGLAFLLWPRDPVVGVAETPAPVVGVAETPAPVAIPAVHLTLGERHVVHVGELKGPRYDRFACGPGGDMWVFVVPWKDPMMYARYQGNDWSPFRRLTQQHWKYVREFQVAFDGTGNPVAIWAGDPEGSGCRLAASTWTGQGWTSPIVLGTADGVTTNSLDVLRDEKGRIHVVYDGQLDPSEMYSVGWLVVDGAWADKCFHAMHDGKQWIPAQPTTGRGRFTVDNLRLSRDPSGGLYLSAVLGRHSRDGHQFPYVAYQKWLGDGWSDFVRVSPDMPYHGNGSMAIDGGGTKIVWRQVSEKIGDYTMEVTATRAGEAMSTEQWYMLHPILRTGPAGRVFLAWSGRDPGIRVWNGDHWSPALITGVVGVGGDSDLTISPDGRVFVSAYEPGKVVIREILLNPADASASRPAP